MALYNMSRFVQSLLKAHDASPPSFTVRLYREYWTLNNGFKLLYNSPTAVSGSCGIYENNHLLMCLLFHSPCSTISVRSIYPSIFWSYSSLPRYPSMKARFTVTVVVTVLYAETAIGCLIVELLDYRPAKNSEPELEQPDRTRVVLTPNDESHWADICLLNQKEKYSLTDADAIEIEARLLVSLLHTSPSLTPSTAEVGHPCVSTVSHRIFQILTSSLF